MELGQVVFSKGFEDQDCPEFVINGLKVLADLIDEGVGNRYLSYNFANNVFEVTPYRDCSCYGDCVCEYKPNFIHKPSGLAVSWYKYLSRGTTINQNISVGEWSVILIDCLNSVLTEEGE